jgi:hypothetical protein
VRNYLLSFQLMVIMALGTSSAVAMDLWKVCLTPMRALGLLVDSPRELSSFSWAGLPPSDVRWKRAIKRAYEHPEVAQQLAEFPKGTPAELSSWERLARSFPVSKDGAALLGPKGQRITKLDTRDRELLAKSDLEGKGREVGQFSMVTPDGTYVSPIIFGEERSIDDPIWIPAFNQFLNGCVGGGCVSGGVHEIVFTHTHPVDELVFGKLFLDSPLSSGDINTAKRLSMRTNVPIRIRAVLPNGYAYEKLFRRGQEVTSPTGP